MIGEDEARQWNKELLQIDEIRKTGHSYHCACRQIWGDGECECDLYKQGYDPYAWMKISKAGNSFWERNKKAILSALSLLKREGK